MGVRVKLSSNRTTILVGRASLVHVSMKQVIRRVEDSKEIVTSYLYLSRKSFKGTVIHFIIASEICFSGAQHFIVGFYSINLGKLSKRITPPNHPKSFLKNIHPVMGR